MADDRTLAPGLYVVSTPIGAARDITLRALDVLRTADVILSEDTRVTRKLLDLHGIPLGDRPVIPYHDHNGAAQRPRILRMLADGKSVAQVSDAGTPLVADPGFALTREVIAAGHAVHPVPGPSAPLAALVASGLPSDRFLFAGFVPSGSGPARKALREVADTPATLIFFESGRRLSSTLKLMAAEYGQTRQAAVCRELTKRFEECRRGTLAELVSAYDGEAPKGEIVVLVDRGRVSVSDEDRDALLAEAMKTMTVKDASAAVAQKLGLSRRDVYQAALDMKKEA